MERMTITIPERELVRLDDYVERVKENGWTTRSAIVREALQAFLADRVSKDTAS